jgi:hypothetical protein
MFISVATSYIVPMVRTRVTACGRIAQVVQGSSRASLNRCIVALAGAWTAVPDWALALTEARSSPFLLVKVRFVSGI